MDTPGERLRFARKRLGISADQLAGRVQRSTSAVRNQENGTNGIPSDLAKEYADALGVQPQWILYGEGAAPKTIAAQIREERERRGWSQAELARRVGTTQQTVDRLERGQTAFSRITAPVLEALGITSTVEAATAPTLPKAPVSLTRLANGDACLALDLTLPFSVALQILALVEGAQK